MERPVATSSAPAARRDERENQQLGEGAGGKAQGEFRHRRVGMGRESAGSRGETACAARVGPSYLPHSASAQGVGWPADLVRRGRARLRAPRRPGLAPPDGRGRLDFGGAADLPELRAPARGRRRAYGRIRVARRAGRSQAALQAARRATHETRSRTYTGGRIPDSEARRRTRSRATRITRSMQRTLRCGNSTATNPAAR